MNFEEAFVDELSKLGIEGTPLGQQFPKSNPEERGKAAKTVSSMRGYYGSGPAGKREAKGMLETMRTSGWAQKQMGG